MDNPLRFLDPAGLTPDEQDPTEPIIEGGTTDTLAFSTWADSVFQAGMQDAFLSGRIAFEAYILSLPSGAAQALVAGVARAIAEAAAAIVLNLMGTTVTLPGGYRETGSVWLSS
jgi:hypothetical protein